ncbi:Transposon TX1 uncharacterized protein, partial [Choanephora cucurbitarum]
GKPSKRLTPVELKLIPQSDVSLRLSVSFPSSALSTTVPDRPATVKDSAPSPTPTPTPDFVSTQELGNSLNWDTDDAMSLDDAANLNKCALFNLDSQLPPSSLPMTNSHSRYSPLLSSQYLVKFRNTQTQAQFIRYLRSLNFDLMAFQETHVSSMNQYFITAQFQAHQALWTHECGLVPLSSMLHLSKDLLLNLDRVIFSKIPSHHRPFLPFYVLVIYAPANSAMECRTFFSSLIETLHSSHLTLDFDRLLVMGDFNYSYVRPNIGTATSLEWVSTLDMHCFNALQAFDLRNLPTFRRNDSITSTIDYIFVISSLQNVLTDATLQLINSRCSDHSLLSVQLAISTTPTEPELWRANPKLLGILYYQCRLIDAIPSILDDATIKCDTPQDKWDFFKRALKRVTKNFGDTSSGEESVHCIANFRAGDCSSTTGGNRELGVKKQRQATERISAFRNDTTEEPCADKETMLHSAHQFYQQLYTDDPVDANCLDAYLNDIAPLPSVSDEDHKSLLAPITIDDIIAVSAKVTAKQSSPDSDGFGYAFLYHLYRFPPLQHSVVQVYSNALLRAPSLITPHQTGFMPGRFIATNGLLVNMVMEHARRTQRDNVALLLDQEKTFDRVHPLYLRRTLLRFNFPRSFFDFLMNLFFGNRVRVNVHGYFSKEDPSFPGFAFDQTTSSNSSSSLEPLKILTYADDVCVFLSDNNDFHWLQQHLALYGQLSNAKVNLHKTEAVSLSDPGMTEPQLQHCATLAFLSLARCHSENW